MSYNFNNLWVEKYRPRKLEEFVISDKNLSYINSFKAKKEIPNLLFVGTPGLGKTSLAKIIVNDILECQYLYINASDENGIDTIRTKVTSFAQTLSIDGKIKAIILDETDGLSMEAQRALRNTIEEFAKITRFILTANYRYRVIPALQSRCQSIDLTPPIEGVVKRCVHVLKSEKVEIPEDQKAKLLEFIKSKYPDLRMCINELQKYSSSGALQLQDTKNDKVIKSDCLRSFLSAGTTNAIFSLSKEWQKSFGQLPLALEDLLKRAHSRVSLRRISVTEALRIDNDVILSCTSIDEKKWEQLKPFIPKDLLSRIEFEEIYDIDRNNSGNSNDDKMLEYLPVSQIKIKNLYKGDDDNTIPSDLLRFSIPLAAAADKQISDAVSQCNPTTKSDSSED